MKKKNSEPRNQSLLQQFAVKKENTQVLIGDRAITYNRCSTQQQDSVEWQSKVTAGIVNQNNWQLIKAFGAKESAKTDDRKEFQEMLRFCKKENISHIVFYSYDRFSRAGKLDLIDDLRNEGIKIHSATQYVNDDTAGGRMVQKLFLVIARMENEQRRDKVIEGQKNKLRKGEWIGIPTIGYEKRYVTGKKEHDHDKKQCFINDTGKLLRQAFNWVDMEKISNTEVIRRLEPMGLSLKLPELTRIFRNPFYCGYITSSLLDDGEIIRGKHEALVSEEVFLRVNGIRNENTFGWNVIRENEEMPLKASVRCNKCNRPLTAYPQKGKYIYYKCPNNGCCVNISNNKLHSLFESELLKYSIDSDLIPAIKTQLENTYWTMHSRDTSREKPMKDELTRLKNELETMELNLAIGKVSPEIYAKHSALHREKIKGIEEELQILSNDSSNLSNLLQVVIQNACNIFKTWHLLDYNGKVKLQKLLFPDGLMYDAEKHTVRTTTVNPIFSAISSYSTILSTEDCHNKIQNSNKFHSVYSMFASSNFFWENLEKASEMPNVWALNCGLKSELSLILEKNAFSGFTSATMNTISILSGSSENTLYS